MIKTMKTAVLGLLALGAVTLASEAQALDLSVSTEAAVYGYDANYQNTFRDGTFPVIATVSQNIPLTQSNKLFATVAVDYTNSLNSGIYGMPKDAEWTDVKLSLTYHLF